METLAIYQDYPTYGTISFNMDGVADNTLSGYRDTSSVTLDIVAIGIVPTNTSSNNYHLKILAWNKLFGEDLKMVFVTMLGDLSNPASGKSIQTSFIYNEGTTQFNTKFDPFVKLYNSTNSGNYKHYRLVLFPMSSNAYVNVNIDPLQRSFSTNIDSLEVNDYFAGKQKIITNISIDANSFSNFPLDNYGITFDCNGKPAGVYGDLGGGTNSIPYESLKNPFATGAYCVADYSHFKGTFYDNGINQLAELKVEFFHYRPDPDNWNTWIYAYKNRGGRVGIQSNLDGSGFTEIQVTATDFNGKIYREQQDQGYVIVKDYQYSQYVNGAKINGKAFFEFSFELKSDDGSIMKIENGNAYTQTTY
ncbi:MAG: hypothetical protein H6599_06950 [Flavobacteriales bacterium]|nr:hypothetical protein [Flavobacteriales bacterium]